MPVTNKENNMLIAKPIVKGQFWIVTDGEKKVGNVLANGNGFGVKINGNTVQFNNTDEIKKNTKIRFEVLKTNKSKISAPYPEYPTPAKTYNSIFDVTRGLHLFTKTKKSKCHHVAGWFIVNHNGTNQIMFCPKYIFIQRYSFVGPFKSEAEAKAEINTCT
jgi:hypothetical protein